MDEKLHNCEISLQGCDDETTFDFPLLDSEYCLLKRIAEKSQEVSTYGCMPIMTVRKKVIA